MTWPDCLLPGYLVALAVAAQLAGAQAGGGQAHKFDPFALSAIGNGMGPGQPPDARMAAPGADHTPPC